MNCAYVKWKRWAWQFLSLSISFLFVSLSCERALNSMCSFDFILWHLSHIVTIYVSNAIFSCGSLFITIWQKLNDTEISMRATSTANAEESVAIEFKVFELFETKVLFLISLFTLVACTFKFGLFNFIHMRKPANAYIVSEEWSILQRKFFRMLEIRT